MLALRVHAAQRTNRGLISSLFQTLTTTLETEKNKQAAVAETVTREREVSTSAENMAAGRRRWLKQRSMPPVFFLMYIPIDAAGGQAIKGRYSAREAGKGGLAHLADLRVNLLLSTVLPYLFFSLPLCFA